MTDDYHDADIVAKALVALPYPAGRWRDLQRVRDRADIPCSSRCWRRRRKKIGCRRHIGGRIGERDGLDQLDYYKQLLLDLGKPEIKDDLVRAIFTDAQTRLRKPTNLKALTTNIDNSIGFPRARKGSATFMRGCLKRTPPTKNQARASISRRDP